MKIRALVFGLSLMFISCSSDDDGFDSILEGRSYTITAFYIETPADVNNDGVYDNNLLNEDTFGCQTMNGLSFRNGTTSAPLEYGPRLYISEANTQSMSCYVIDYFAPISYMVDEENMTVNIAGFIGQISGDTISFRLNNSELDSLGEILLEDGTTETYTGNYILEFTRLHLF